MTTAPVLKTKALEANDIRALARCEGPCITMQLPEWKPASGQGSRNVSMSELAHLAIETLRNFSSSSRATEVESRMMRAVGQFKPDSGERGGPAMTLIFSPEVQDCYATPSVLAPSVTVASRVNVLPLIAAAEAPHEIFALGISRKHIRLWRVGEGAAVELPLPSAVPASLEAAGEFDRPDHDLENRSAAGAGSGHMKRVRFGTLSDHDGEDEYMHKFMILVYKGVRELAKTARLFLIGVREDLLEFRRAARQNGICEAEWHANPEHCSLDEVRRKAEEAALNESYAATVSRLDILRTNHAHYLTAPVEIYKAACAGRVHRLFVAELANFTEEQPPETGLFPGENLLNTAAAEVLRNGGEVFAGKGTALSTGDVAVAVLRY